jgi:drug/metabolite transporter (DMT)-like permease
MFRNQPPGFRWLVGGFALLAGCAFLVRFFHGDRASLLFAVLCLALACYWLVFDREPAGREPADREPAEPDD